ncbi:NUMOD4 domain-containing protein [Variovorax sp. J22R133]|uniref:NUMOD4 domain-containing protein n=1 Tax=Variovorax brevis TaxID=3053503 RepID=UPI002578B3F5|nr:NUMOD4 domain-containing protein [Variovorax sp. J22R133]MDM0117279.1 NUMOD4 domain-containing protein [Variovorax sp. J22R133]
MEKWKPIAGFAYEVSNQGRVRSIARKMVTASGRGSGSVRGRILKGRPNQRGHLRVCLCGDGVTREVSVSRLVATCFVANPGGLPFVRHKDFNRANNDASNLEWCSNSTSLRKAIEAGRFTALVSPARARTLQAETASMAYTLRLAGLTFREIAAMLDIGTEAAMKVCHARAWKHESRPTLARKSTRRRKNSRASRVLTR